MQVNSKADDKAAQLPQGIADAQDPKQAGHGQAEHADATPLQRWVDYKQERVRSLEARLEDAERAREYHRQVRAYQAEHFTTDYETDAVRPITLSVE